MGRVCQKGDWRHSIEKLGVVNDFKDQTLLFFNLYRPSKCDLRLYLQLKGVDPALPSAFEQVLFRLGQRHEKNHLFTFPEFTDLTGEPSERTLEEIRKANPVIYQGD